MKKRKASKSSRAQIKSAFSKFKKHVEKKLGQINWNQVGIFALALLLMAALKGFLGPEARFIALGIVKLSAYV